MSKGSMNQVNSAVSSFAGPQRSAGEQSEPERSEGPAKLAAGSPRVIAPDPEVREIRSRRRFSASYKAGIVEQAMACREHGAIAALLRREGLYSSQLATWRAQYERGALRGLADDTRGRKSKRNPLDAEVQALRKQNTHLERRLKQAEAIIAIQKKVSEILEIPLPTIDEDDEGH